MKVDAAAGLFLLGLAACAASAGELKLASSGPREAVIELPGGQAKLSLVKAWGRTCEPNKSWNAEGDKLPTLVFKSGEDWIEASIPVKPEKDEFIRIHRFDLDLSGAAAWQDADGKRTFLRRGPQWPSVGELLAKQPAFPDRWAWPVGPGLTHLVDKKTSVYGLGAEDVWTGFSGELFKGVKDPLLTVDRPAVARADQAGNLLVLAADEAIAIACDGGSRLVLCALLRGAQAGKERQVRIRIRCGRGAPGELASDWISDLGRVPLRVFFVGSSTSAAKGSYAETAMAALSREFGGKVRVMNASRGGATTKEVLDAWPARVLDYAPNLVVIQLCANDVGQIKPEDVAVNLRKMIDSILAAPGGRAVVLTPLSYDKKRIDDLLAKGTDLHGMHTEQYIPALQKLVAGYEAGPGTKGRVVLVNIWQALAKARAEKGADCTLMPDGVHPGDEGNKILYDAVWPELKRLAEATLKEVEEKR